MTKTQSYENTVLETVKKMTGAVTKFQVARLLTARPTWKTNDKVGATLDRLAAKGALVASAVSDGYTTYEVRKADVAPTAPSANIVTVTTPEVTYVIRFDAAADYCWSCKFRGLQAPEGVGATGTVERVSQTSYRVRTRSLEHMMSVIAHEVGRDQF